jgi:hypothetical protein
MITTGFVQCLMGSAAALGRVKRWVLSLRAGAARLRRGGKRPDIPTRARRVDARHARP